MALSTRTKSLLIIILFSLVLLLPVTYGLIRAYFFAPHTETAPPQVQGKP